MRDRSNNPVLQKITQLRKKKGLGQGALAKGLRKSQTGYSALERGHNRMLVDDLLKIAEILEVSPAELFEEGNPLEITRFKGNQQAARESSGVLKDQEASFENKIDVKKDIHLVQFLDCWSEMTLNQKRLFIEMAREILHKPDYDSFLNKK